MTNGIQVLFLSKICVSASTACSISKSLWSVHSITWSVLPNFSIFIHHFTFLSFQIIKHSVGWYKKN